MKSEKSETESVEEWQVDPRDIALILVGVVIGLLLSLAMVNLGI